MATAAKVEGNVIDIGKGISDHGHCWGLAAIPTISNFKTSLGVMNKTGIFTSDLPDLESRKLYHVRAYVKSGDEVLYGVDKEFTTLGSPILTTTFATGITSSSATIGGNITSDGGSAITDRGVFWRSSTNPDTTGTKLQISSGVGSFSTTVSGLSPNTLYFFKAYAANSLATTYGAKLSFITLSPVPGAPVIGTATAGDSQVVVTFNPPVSNGGSAITGYTVTSSPGGISGTGSTSPIIVTGLTNGTTYTFTVVASNANGPGAASIASNPVTPSSTSVTDVDGNVYNSVTIGSQVWMVNNLKTSKYSNGDVILTGLNDADWHFTTAGAYSIYNNNNTNNDTYGKLYNYYSVVDKRNLCPTGWHVPNKSEYEQMINYLGGNQVAYAKILQGGSSGFNLTFGGIRDFTGAFGGMGTQATIWSSSDPRWYLNLSSSSQDIAWASPYSTESSNRGFSIRCIKN
jgi:uncharacterized protein (TIGR02145 family)